MSHRTACAHATVEHEQLTLIIRLGRLLCAICDTDQRQNLLDSAVGHFKASQFTGADVQDSVYRNRRCVHLASGPTLPAFLALRFPSPVSVPQVPSPCPALAGINPCLGICRCFRALEGRHQNLQWRKRPAGRLLRSNRPC